MKKLFFLLAGIFFFSAVFASSVLAVEVPSFPSCPNPGGSVLASYDSGDHGIVGGSSSSGSDSVYQTSGNSVVQCLCNDNTGVQTNWWQIGEMSQEEIQSFVNQGWIYVPDGSAWGLSSGPYLAQNINGSCGGGNNNNNNSGGGGGTSSAPTCTDAKPPTPTLLSIERNGTTAKLTWTAVSPASYYTIAYGLSPDNYIYGVPNTGNVTSFTVGSLNANALYYFAVRAVNNCMPGDFATISYGGIGGGEVLGLATTGDAPQRLLILSFGLGLLVLGLGLAWSQRRHTSR